MFLLLAALASVSAPSDSLAEAAVAARVEIVRTEYGVPHLLAEDLEALGFGLAWVQSEDYGGVVAHGLVRARGHLALHLGRDSIASDFGAREARTIARATFDRLEPATRDVYDGFAAGVNHFVRLHRDRFPDWMPTDFSGEDVHARDVQTWSRGDARRFLRERARAAEAPGSSSAQAARAPSDGDEGFALDGSNAWALDGTRTTSGHAILLRNPHLSWAAGYYEAHARVPGVLDFYGDFRIGGPFGIIGGFNRRLGWATTNNYPRYSQVYAFETDPDHPDQYRLDGSWHPLEVRADTVVYRDEAGRLLHEVRTTSWTTHGPVIHREAGRIYALKDPRHGEFRRGEQFLRMMRSTTFAEWIDIVRLRAHPSSNFTYADADGTIAHVYNARLPALPHEPTGDTAALARASADVWTELVPFEELPLYVNPPGGYVQQANDTPDYTNLHVPMDRDTVPANLPEPRLRLRSQLSLDLLHGDARLSLEDVVRLKHSPRVPLAERVLDDLISAARERGPGSAVDRAVDVLDRWDRTAAAASRGGVLFVRWAERYRVAIDTARFFREPWTPERPLTTPVGLGEPDAAVAALEQAVRDLAEDGLALDVAWGDVHRVLRGDVDAPVSGCPSDLGCFRTLSFERDGARRVANRGDAWVLAVEFGPTPRAYSILAYGQSALEDSPHFDDQALPFARGEMKPVAFTDAEIEAQAIARYRPGRP